MTRRKADLEEKHGGPEEPLRGPRWWLDSHPNRSATPKSKGKSPSLSDVLAEAWAGPQRIDRVTRAEGSEVALVRGEAGFEVVVRVPDDHHKLRTQTEARRVVVPDAYGDPRITSLVQALDLAINDCAEELAKANFDDWFFYA